jgi:hypothetical protein
MSSTASGDITPPTTGRFTISVTIQEYRGTRTSSIKKNEIPSFEWMENVADKIRATQTSLSYITFEIRDNTSPCNRFTYSTKVNYTTITLSTNDAMTMFNWLLSCNTICLNHVPSDFLRINGTSYAFIPNYPLTLCENHEVIETVKYGGILIFDKEQSRESNIERCPLTAAIMYHHANNPSYVHQYDLRTTSETPYHLERTASVVFSEVRNVPEEVYDPKRPMSKPIEIEPSNMPDMFDRIEPSYMFSDALRHGPQRDMRHAPFEPYASPSNDRMTELIRQAHERRGRAPPGRALDRSDDSRSARLAEIARSRMMRHSPPPPQHHSLPQRNSRKGRGTASHGAASHGAASYGAASASRDLDGI